MTATEPSTEVAIPVRATGSFALRQSPAALAAEAMEIREVMRAVLVEGTDYGTIPGVARPSLFKSGAEWLLKWGGFGHKLEPVETERDEHGRKFGVTYRCTVHLLHDPLAIVSTCDGYAGYDEDRMSQSVEELEAKERANATKYKRPANESKWAVAYRAPWNSVLKMAEKRALVGATLQACAASGLFTQDMEDHAPAGVAKAPEDWFVANGWPGGDAEESEAMRALTAKAKAYPESHTPEEVAALKDWMASAGLDWKARWSRAMHDTMDAKLDVPSAGAEDATGDETTVEPVTDGAGVGEEPDHPRVG